MGPRLEQVEEEEGLTPDHVDLVQSSWAKVVPIADVAADLFYTKLFELDVELRPLFPDDLAGQKKKLMEMIGLAVDGLTNLDELVPAVQDLGRKHATHFKVTPPMYDTVGAALLDTLEKGLGNLWDEEHEEAWTLTYGVLSQTMIGAGEEIETPEDGASEEKEEGLTPKKIELVQSSWAKVVPIADVAADLFYTKLFELDSELRPLFPDDLAGQKKKLMEMIGLAVDGLTNLDELVPAVQDLGRKHATHFKVTPPMYDTVGAALLDTLEKGLGDGWDDAHKEAWALVYGVLSQTMIGAGEETETPVEEEGLTAEQLVLVQSSWAKVVPIADVAADLFYNKLFELDPEIRPMFPEDMSKQKTKLMDMLTLAVDGLSNIAELIPAVQELGRRHAKYYKVTPQMYDTVGAALLDTLEKGLGDAWDEEHEKAWAITYAAIGKTMIAAGEEPEVVPIVKIAVIGCGWWAQGWHLPHLAANPNVEIAAVVDPAPQPVSTLSASDLLSLSELSKKYGCACYTSVADLLAGPIGPTLDGVIVATIHAAHYNVGMTLLNEGIHRRQMSEAKHRALHILMEKPLTTDVDEAVKLLEMSTKQYPEGAFIINHTANYRLQTEVARQVIASDQIGKIRHISASMNGGLMWLFDDARNHGWVSKTPWKKPGANGEDTKDEMAPMTGNGYAWGQIAHVLAWIYAVLGAGDNSATGDIAVPTKVYCTMSHSAKTGADVSLAVVITCRDGVTFSLNGTALLPGSQYVDPPIGKQIRIELYGENGSLTYGGDDNIPESGRLELRKSVVGKKEDGQSEFPCSKDWSGVLGDSASELKDGFYFEDGAQEGTGPGSMKAFLGSCHNSAVQFNDGKELSGSVINDSLIGLRTVQIIDAMYRSALSGNAEQVDGV